MVTLYWLKVVKEIENQGNQGNTKNQRNSKNQGNREEVNPENNFRKYDENKTY